MFDVLQSSYADVEFEVNVMRNAYLSESILFVAGDGLALMRLNHLLASKPDLYFDQTPFIVPVQGEHNWAPNFSLPPTLYGLACCLRARHMRAHTCPFTA